jgi:hypothetical protein
MKKTFLSLLVLALLAAPARLLAWNGIGHGTGGALTYYILKKGNTARVSKILATLTLHPWYNTKWHDRLAGFTPQQKEVALFMLASTFPDDARNTPYDRPTWHYIDYPFAPPGQGGNPQRPPVPNAETKIDSLARVLKTAPENADKAIGICWLLHLVEDIHQPLHATGLFTGTFPHGDHGGNYVFIKLNPTTSPVKLHAYWDGLIKGTFNTIPGLAWQRFNDSRYAPARLTELSAHRKLHEWLVMESFPLAKSYAYANGTVNGDRNHPVAVDQAYTDKAKVIAERRIVLSGYRLAGFLRTIYAG